MVTDNAIAELIRWGQAAFEGDFGVSEKHLRQFYHLGAALVASKEFQLAWRSKWQEQLAPGKLQDACHLLEMIADVEAAQRAALGTAGIPTPIQ
jgi:hypothetical protein